MTEAQISYKSIGGCTDLHPMPIANGRKLDLRLDVQGLQLFKRDGRDGRDGRDDRDDRELVQDASGAKRVVSCLDPILRGPEGNKPLFVAHADCTYRHGENVLRQLFGDEANDLIKRRFVIYQIWRPLAPVEKTPLALADFRSIRETDLLIARKKALFGEIYGLSFNPGHSWFYFPDM